MLSHESLAEEHRLGIMMKARDLDDLRERERERDVGMMQEPGAWPLEQSREGMNRETEGSGFMRHFSVKPSRMVLELR